MAYYENKDSYIFTYRTIEIRRHLTKRGVSRS